MIPCRFTHSRKVHVEPFCFPDVLIFYDSSYLIFKILHGYITMISEFRNITKFTIHRTSFLSGNGGHPLLAQIYFTIDYSMYFLMKPQKISLDVVFFAIIPDCKKLYFFFVININLACMRVYHSFLHKCTFFFVHCFFILFPH